MNFGDYLLKLRESRNISKTEMANKMDVSLPYYSALERSDKKPPTFGRVVQIVKILNLTPKEESTLIELALKERTSPENHKFLQEIIDFQERKSWSEGEEDQKKSYINPYIPAQEVPILSWVHAADFKFSYDSDFPVGHGIFGKIHTDLIGKHLFALKVENVCMEPKFRHGQVIIVDPDQACSNGDYVIAKLMDEGAATFKQLKIYDNRIILHPINPSFPDIEFTKKEFDIKVKIVGKVVRVQEDF